MEKVAVFSNKFSPAHVQHLKAYFKSFSELGYDCTLILDDKYQGWFDEQYKLIYKSEWLKSEKHQYDIIWIYNISKIDIKMIKQIKDYKSIKKYIVVHEPWCGIKQTLINLFFRKEVIKEIIKSFGRKFYLAKLLRLKFSVVLCSKNAKRAFDNYYKKTKSYLFSLIFVDELGSIDLSLVEKKYFSFIGNATLAHGFDKFIEYIKHHKELVYQIITSTNIDSYLDSDLVKMIGEGHLVVKHGRYLSDKEIDEAYLHASILWLNYKRSTQSGCLGKAFMFGTPVICSKGGSFEEYVNISNGIFINSETDFDYSRLLDKKVFDCCRKSYMGCFDYKTHLPTLKKIVETNG